MRNDTQNQHSFKIKFITDSVRILDIYIRSSIHIFFNTIYMNITQNLNHFILFYRFRSLFNISTSFFFFQINFTFKNKNFNFSIHFVHFSRKRSLISLQLERNGRAVKSLILISRDPD